MHYVYILQSQKDKKLYTGCTKDLRARLLLHNAQKVHSTYARGPFKIVYYEAFTNKPDAFSREQWLKTGWGRNHLKKLLHNTLKV